MGDAPLSGLICIDPDRKMVSDEGGGGALASRYALNGLGRAWALPECELATLGEPGPIVGDLTFERDFFRFGGG